jgi:4-hydroxythreonine-4-phosphate dehydrogenase
MKTLAFTCGDINGIGPEICLKTISTIFNRQERIIILFCPAKVFEQTLKSLKTNLNFRIIKKYLPSEYDSEFVSVVDFGSYKQQFGKPTKQSGAAAFKALQKASGLVISKKADAMVTAPISKEAFKMAGMNYPGQTELLAELSGSKKYLMTFLSDEYICGLTTIHEPIKNISRLITEKRVKLALEILYSTLLNDLKIKTPKIAVLGLNPHAGENGKIGNEEKSIIIPAIKSFKNPAISGPFVPDAFFGNQLQKKYDAVLGMYHDQVLIPFKMANFNSGVNYTAGLPVIRTSPDHGTGYDIAGSGTASDQSMTEAVKWAERIIDNRRQNINAR